MSKNKINKTIVINGETFHLNKQIPADAKSEHHIIGKMNRIQYNTNEKINRIMISDRKHQALNRFFLQSQSPHEQLRDMVKLWEPVLSEWVKEELYAILSLPRDLFYDESLIKDKHKWKGLFSDDIIDLYKKKL